MKWLINSLIATPLLFSGDLQASSYRSPGQQQGGYGQMYGTGGYGQSASYGQMYGAGGYGQPSDFGYDPQSMGYPTSGPNFNTDYSNSSASYGESYPVDIDSSSMYGNTQPQSYMSPSGNNNVPNYSQYQGYIGPTSGNRNASQNYNNQPTKYSNQPSASQNQSAGNNSSLDKGISYADEDYDDVRSYRQQGQVYGRGANSPICQAINAQKRVEVVLKNKEIVSPRELRMEVKRIIVDPYALGTTLDGPVLQGNVVSEEVLKEVIIKVNQDQFQNEDNRDGRDAKQGRVGKDGKKSGWLGWFKSGKEDGKAIDLSRVIDIHVLDESFDAPKNYKGFEDSDIEVICQIQTQ
jgi:hypothetical protein